jgi:hypothetical protein
MIDIEKIKKDRICPKCGQKISYIEKKLIGRNTYLYAVHVKREGGKRKVKRCYLGPEISITLTGPISVGVDSSVNMGSQITVGKSSSVIDMIVISKDLLNDIVAYYDKRRTKEIDEERRAKVIEVFRKVFSPGKRIVEVETP